MPPHRANRYDVITDGGGGGTQPGKRVGLIHGEEDFEFGITFTVKYIGTQDIAQPHNRVEIVAAMRRIRFECKARGITKQKINLSVSIKGVKVVLFRRNKKKYQAENLPILEHPIYRIFYVSHDSHDLLIFSYISRESSTNQFRCNVFKAFKKSHAVEVVRTIGQAFDICHRTAVEAEHNDQQKTKDDDNSDRAAQHADTCRGNGPCALVACQNSVEQTQTSSLDSGHSTGSDDVIQSAQRVLDAANFKRSSVAATAFKTVGTITSPMVPLSLALTEDFGTGNETLSGQHQIRLLLQRQKELQSQQMHCLLSQMQLLKDQLAAETDARVDAQSRIHQLLGQNQELLEHIDLLVQRLVQLEAPRASITQSEISQYSTIPHLPAFSVTCSTEHPVQSAGAFTLPRSIQSPSNQVAVSVQNASPDSGHREMSSDSLSASNNTDARLSLRSWHTPSSNQTFHTMSAFGVKKSLVAVASTKSLDISKIAKDNFHANQRNPCSYGDYYTIPDEKLIFEDSEKHCIKEQSNPNPLSSIDSARPNNSSVMILQAQCSYNTRLTSEIVTGPGRGVLPTQSEDVSKNLTDPVIMRASTYCSNNIVDNFSASAEGTDAKLFQCNTVVDTPISFRGGGDGGNVGVVESVVTGGVVGGNEATSNDFCVNAWSQSSTFSLHSKSLVRDSSLDHVTVNSLPFGLSNQLTNLNG